MHGITLLADAKDSHLLGGEEFLICAQHYPTCNHEIPQLQRQLIRSKLKGINSG